MSPQPTFDNDYLRESLYEAVLNFLPNGLSISTQNILSQCIFGIVPSPYQVRTVLIIAPCPELADNLLLDIDNIKARVMYLMPDIRQIGICVEPIGNKMADLEPTSVQIFPATSPSYLMGRFFLLCRENN